MFSVCLRAYSCGPNEPCVRSDKTIGRNHSQLRGVKSRRCGLLPNYLEHFFSLTYSISFSVPELAGCSHRVRDRGVMYKIVIRVVVLACRDASVIDPEWLYEASPPSFQIHGRQLGRLHVEHQSGR